MIACSSAYTTVHRSWALLSRPIALPIHELVVNLFQPPYGLAGALVRFSADAASPPTVANRNPCLVRVNVSGRGCDATWILCPDSWQGSSESLARHLGESEVA